MRTILHISDLHFGRSDDDLLAPLRAAAIDARPDLTVVSGDLTQRARPAEFKAARAYIDTLPGPKLVVPGNHDVPIHLLRRFVRPLAGYLKHVDKDPEPLYEDEEMVVLGLNSARSLTVQDGRLNYQQIERLGRTFYGAPAGVTRVLVCHHPVVLPPGSKKEEIENAQLVLETMAACSADAILTGHLHTSHHACRVVRTPDSEWNVVLIQAGTATSTRLRGEQAAFNLLRIQEGVLEVSRHVWSEAGTRYEPNPPAVYQRGERGWTSLTGPCS